MGWKGALRSVQASIRAAERDARRRQRQLQLQQKQYERMQEFEQASLKVNADGVLLRINRPPIRVLCVAMFDTTVAFPDSN